MVWGCSNKKNNNLCKNVNLCFHKTLYIEDIDNKPPQKEMEFWW